LIDTHLKLATQCQEAYLNFVAAQFRAQLSILTKKIGQPIRLTY
jgi:hypothetical protein